MPPAVLPLKRNIVIHRGRTFRSRTYRLKDAEGAAVSLAGLTIAATLARALSREAADKIADFTVERDDAAGEFTLVLSDIKTAAIDSELTGGNYDIEITDAAGEALQFAAGSVKIEGTVTV
jgi:hypothetical protein